MTEAHLKTTTADEGIGGASAEQSTNGSAPMSLSVPKVAIPVAAVAAIFALIAHPLGAGGLLAAFTSAVLVVLAAFDIQRRVIPNRIVLPATAVVLVAQALIAPAHIGRYVAAALIAALIMAVPGSSAARRSGWETSSWHCSSARRSAGA